MSESSSTEPFIEKEPLFNAENTSGNENSDRADCSVLEVSYNIANTVLGAGAIGLPYALKESGLVFGIILLIFVGYLTHFSLVLMIKIGKTKNIDSFSQLALVSMGKVGFWFLNFFIFINGVGTMLAYLIIIGSTLPPLIEAYITTSFVSSRPFVVGITGSLIILPLLFWRDIGKKLSKFSFLGVIALPVIIVLITARAFFGPCYHKEHQVKIEIFGDHIFSSIGVMAFAFICNQTAYMNYRSLKNRTVARWSRSSFIALTFSLIISLTIAILGFFAFGDDLKSNVLNNFPVNDGYINFARAVLGCNMFVTFPMQFYPARSAFQQMIGVEDHALGKIPSVASHVTITLFLFILILVPGLFVENLGIVLELVGALCSCSISFLFPGLAVSFILHKLGRGGDTEAAEPLLDGNDENGEKVGKVYRIGNIVMLLFGFMTLVLATSTTVMKNLSKDY